MKIKLTIVFSIVFLIAIVAIGEFYAKIPLPSKETHIEEIATIEPLSSGAISFRAQNKKTKAVTTVYKSDLTPGAALDEMTLALETQGYSKVFATQSLVIMENTNRGIAALQAYLKDGETIVASIVQ